MSKVYILRIEDPDDVWIANVYATKELAYEAAMRCGKKIAERDGTHLVEAKSDDECILFAENDTDFWTGWWTIYVIDEWDVKKVIDEADRR